MEVISMSFLKDVLKGNKETGAIVSGVLLVSNYNITLTKTNKEYISGSLLSGVTVPFKAWGSSTAFSKFKTEEYSNTPVFINGTVDNFGGSGSIIVNDVTAVSDFTPDQFLEQRYNIEAYYDALMSLIERNVSDKAMGVISTIFTDDVKNAFKMEFAATSHHDNCKGGLLAHTYKCVSLMNWVITTYPSIAYVVSDDGLVVSQDRKDLLFLGILLHDIGKIKEMNLGVYQNCSKVTHRFLGIEYVEPAKETILSSYGESWYYDLVSILLQHHGEYADPCRTLVSFICSKVDLLESQLTLVQQCLLESVIHNNSGSSIRIDNTWLNLD